MTMWRGVLGQFDITWAWGSAWQELSIIFFSAFSFLVQVRWLRAVMGECSSVPYLRG